MVFQKGHKTNIGKKFSIESKKKMSLSAMGHKNNLGKKRSIEWKKKISEINKGNKYNLGRKHTAEMRKKISIAKRKNPTRFWLGKKRMDISGEKNFRWIKDRNNLQKYQDDNKNRRSSTYRDWRKNVWIRDNFKCKMNNLDCNGRIEAHHILGYTEYPELRYKVNNGITLCHAHHPRKRAEEKQLVPYFMGLVEAKV